MKLAHILLLQLLLLLLLLSGESKSGSSSICERTDKESLQHIYGALSAGAGPKAQGQKGQQWRLQAVLPSLRPSKTVHFESRVTLALEECMHQHPGIRHGACTAWTRIDPAEIFQWWICFNTQGISKRSCEEARYFR